MDDAFGERPPEKQDWMIEWMVQLNSVVEQKPFN